MTAERRQDIALIALVLSMAMHVGIMYYMKPQVMTQVTSSAHRTRARGPMEMRDRPPESDSVHIDVLKDLAALKEAPNAVAEGPAPAVADFEAAEQAPSASAPDIDNVMLALPIPEMDAIPELSERFSTIEGESPMVTPISPVGHTSMTAATAEAEDAPVESVAAEVTPDLFVPEFESPAIPEVSADVIADESRIDFAALKGGDKGSDFRPETEVMPTVDEKIVEAEKAAVRDLLDVHDAGDLDRFVTTSIASAQEGEWTYFKVKVEPGAELATVPKDIVVLMDASGSIGKDRLASCREAARKILRSCTNSGDRFNLVAFRDKFSYAFNTWQECDRDSFDRADKWLSKLVAHGRTDVFATIRSVLTLPRDPARPLIAMVVTDGDANAGISETAQILSKFTALNDGLVSVYMYGVKGSANRELLDVLTHGNRGESFIYGGTRWKAGSGIETLAERFRDPVLSDLRIVFATGSEAEVYPQRLKNLYKGEAVELVGRVPAGTREVSFSLKGLNGTNPYEGFFTIPLAETTFDSGLPTDWRSELEIDKKLR